MTYLKHIFDVSLVLCILLWLCVHNGECSHNLAQETSQYCPYFQNRAPTAQPSLQNCTWYRENACCLDEELSIIFSDLLPMVGANGECLKALNHLYCYVCSPHQSSFFSKEMLTVCEESCNLIYSKCSNARFKGVPWRELYANGTEFCTARKFLTEKAETKQCFDFTGFYNTNSVEALQCSREVLASSLIALIFSYKASI